MTEWSVSFRVSNNGNIDKLLVSLGLCVRAGKVIFGVPQICDALRKGGRGAPILVLEAADTSDNTHKRLCDKCKYYKVRHIRLECTSGRLAEAVGKSAQLGAVAITDEGISRLVEKYI